MAGALSYRMVDLQVRSPAQYVAFGESLAQAFVARKFAGSSKQAAELYVAEIGAAMSRRLDQLAWMDAATRTRAKKKLQSMAYLIGYPKRWRTYDWSVTDTCSGL